MILADSAYGAQPCVCKPLANPISNAEKIYQKAQIKTRNCAERGIGLWKRVFACLGLGMRYKLEKSQDVILACAILHNFLIIEKELNVENPFGQQELEYQRNLSEQLVIARREINRQLSVQRFLIDRHFNV